MSIMPQEFAFTDGDRTFTCCVEAARTRGETPRGEPARGEPARGDAWWWFSVSTERHQRHAPFRATADDTLGAVATRMVAYYDDLLARRAAPPVTKWQRRPVAAAPDAVAVGAAAADAPEKN